MALSGCWMFVALPRMCLVTNQGMHAGPSIDHAKKAGRKMVKKAIQKAMKNLKAVDNISTFSSLNKDNETFSIVSKLRDVEAITLAVFESPLSFISGPKSQPSS
ncbi:unnamed protein product [Prunus armeniaca]